jgi:hypothetical protein
VKGPAKPPGVPVNIEGPVPRASTERTAGAARGACEARGVERADSGVSVARTDAAPPSQVVRALDQVGEAQKRLDHILELAESGRSFSPTELLALQAQVYRASQELDLAGKVLEKATGGVKQVLQTQV